MFASFTLFAPEPERRSGRWRLASSLHAADHWPILQAVAAIGAAWAAWRGTGYLFALELWPYAAFWFGLSLWFLSGLLLAWPRSERA